MRAPEFPDDLSWLNTDQPLSLSMLRGHVVLLDFWTYCCINCLHILPDLAWLEEKYRDEPFLVIGVHAAKFNNEKEIENIEHAIQRYEINHPVVVDNQHWIWQSYTIKAWPSFVLIDSEGRIVSMMSGEGKRKALDEQIAQTLAADKQNGKIAENKIEIQTPPRPKHTLSFPSKLAYNPDSGHLFVSDSNHHRILELKLIPDNRACITRVIGSGEVGRKDGGFASASFFRPQGMAYHAGKLYICDTDNHLIREADMAQETVRTIAGSGWENIWDGPSDEAYLAQPSGIASDGEWLYFADSEVSALRKARIADGQVVTLVGSGLFDFGLQDGPFPAAQLQHPLGVAYHDGKVYVADTYNHAIRIAYLEAERMDTLVWRPVKTVCRIENEECSVLPLNEPNDMLIVEDKLYIADTNNHLIRVLDLKTKKLEDVHIE